MNPRSDVAAKFQAAWADDSAAGADTDYSLVAEIEGAYAARSRSGLPALVVPIANLDSTPLGRHAAGCELLGHPSTRFLFAGRSTVGSAAALVCIDPDLRDVFAILAADISSRSAKTERTWASVLSLVEDWQTLLTPQARASAALEMGLWGELWFIHQALDVDRALAGWRGPDGDATDFFLGGKSVEVKTSRRRRQHHISQTQVSEPVGTHEAWLLSVWVKADPSAVTVAGLAHDILNRAKDRGDALRRLARAGFMAANRGIYTTAFAVLDEPEWYATADVPRVRAADPGVSQLRYQVTLERTRRADAAHRRTLWRHFHGRAYKGI